MNEYSDLKNQLKGRLAELVARAEEIENELRQPLDDDLPDQAIDLADDEALAGVDEVLRQEIADTRNALLRIENGSYGTCANCGSEISEMRLKALPTATLCINCA